MTEFKFRVIISILAFIAAHIALAVVLGSYFRDTDPVLPQMLLWAVLGWALFIWIFRAEK